MLPGQSLAHQESIWRKRQSTILRNAAGVPAKRVGKVVGPYKKKPTGVYPMRTSRRSSSSAIVAITVRCELAPAASCSFDWLVLFTGRVPGEGVLKSALMLMVNVTGWT